MQSSRHILFSAFKQNNIISIVYVVQEITCPCIQYFQFFITNLNSAVINSAPLHLYNPKIFYKLRNLFYLETSPCTFGKLSISQQVQKIRAYYITWSEQHSCIVMNTHKMTCALLACNCSTFSPEVKFRH